MVDHDGSFSYSPIKMVRLPSSNRLQLYPNPASASIRVRLHSVNGGSETLYLYNAAGSLVQTRKLSLEPGVNRTTLDISTLPKGLYHVRAEKHLVGPKLRKKLERSITKKAAKTALFSTTN
jgi:hypothetical protein